MVSVSDYPPIDGETLGDYARRAILQDAEFRTMITSLRSFDVDIHLPGLCRPAFLTEGTVNEYFDKLARYEGDPRHDGFRRMLDHLWLANNPSSLPLGLRMLDVKNVDLGPPANPPKFADANRAAASLAVRAGKLRDIRIAQLFDQLRLGSWQASGFVPGDRLRTMTPIAPAWWADIFMECIWHSGELRPMDATSAGRPTFLGVSLHHLSNPTKASATPLFSPIAPFDPKRKTHTPDEEDACADWLIQEWPNAPSTKKAAWLIEAKKPGRWPLLSKAAFERAWAIAAKTHPKMGEGGRPPNRRGIPKPPR